MLDTAMHARLLDWYAASARDLPWRRTTDPYAIWISEAMLQQTRVETVESYWARFLDALPTVRELAMASEDRVLTLWSGLGYYRRARSLHAAAKVMVEGHDGAFPRTLEEALDLPGVGPYTAAAVLSIAFDAPLALVDGNVERVFARHFLIEERLGSAPLKREAWELARSLVPGSGAGTWNQALMELGATVCTPRAPGCTACPLAQSCGARLGSRVGELPLPKPKAETVDVALELAWIGQGARILLERRPTTGRMAGMWQLPTREVTRSGLFPPRWPVSLELGQQLGHLRHAITRHRIRAEVLLGRAPAELPEAWGWVSAERLADTPLTGMTSKALRTLDRGAATLPALQGVLSSLNPAPRPKPSSRSRA